MTQNIKFEDLLESCITAAGARWDNPFDIDRTENHKKSRDAYISECVLSLLQHSLILTINNRNETILQLQERLGKIDALADDLDSRGKRGASLGTARDTAIALSLKKILSEESS